MNNDNINRQIIILCVSMILVAVVVVLYFADKSFEWANVKIVSCIIASLWIFFIVPALRQSYIENETDDLSVWFEKGLAFGASGICIPALFAPYFGVRYYIVNNR